MDFKFSKVITGNFIFRKVFTLFFFVLYFLYIRFRIDPSLGYHWQEPSFFLGSGFLNQFLQYPGGLIRYAAKFISQFYYFPWLGTLIITITAWLISQITLKMLNLVVGDIKFHILHLLPAVLLIPLFSLYAFPYELVLGLFVSLLAFVLYAFYRPRIMSSRFIITLISFVLVYYLVGGVFFLFVLLVVLYELFVKKSLLLPVFQIVFSLLLPIITINIFVILLKDDVLSQLPSFLEFKPRIAPFLLYGFYIVLIPAVVIGKVLSKSIFEKGVLGKVKSFYRKTMFSTPGYIIKTAALLLLAVYFSLISFDRETKVMLTMDNYAQNKKWVEILELAQKRITTHRLVTFHTFRALYFTNNLSNNMFSFPQSRGLTSLIMSREFAYSAPLQCSNLYVELGLINEAQHWAHEALALKKLTPAVLQQMTLTSMINGNTEFAQLCLNKLKKSLLFKKWADTYQIYIENPNLFRSMPTIRQINAIQVTGDFYIRDNSPNELLELIIKNSSNNRMAFEYLMAYYLLAGNLEGIVNNIFRLQEFHYNYIPRHYEEALLLYKLKTGKKNLDLGDYQINTITEQRFEDFNSTLAKYPDGKISAQKELARKHGNTLWYYAMYY
ncbi:hypothetical protein JXQ31_00740 [candidate division KSB1 bacterium]|nr:hypothetical protein [candidate division KSB1 bacterium]